jgi:serine/threonine protein kinase
VFALKAQSKHTIVSKGQQEHVMNELHITNDIDHQNIVRIHCAMQDDKYLYFLLDLLPGKFFGICAYEEPPMVTNQRNVRNIPSTNTFSTVPQLLEMEFRWGTLVTFVEVDPEGNGRVFRRRH